MRLGALLLMVGMSTAVNAEGDSYWYFISEESGAFKYSRVLQCLLPIRESTNMYGTFIGNNVVGPFKTYDEADYARSRDIEIAIKAGKKIVLGEGTCNI